MTANEIEDDVRVGKYEHGLLKVKQWSKYAMHQNDIILPDGSTLTVNFGKPLRDEDAHQGAIFQWKNKAQRQGYDNLRWLHSIPNGGARDKVTAGVLKRTGVTAGILDMNLPLPTGDYAGLWIEQKYGSNKLSKDQVEFGNWLIDNHHAVYVSYDWKISVALIVDYIHNRIAQPVKFK